MPRPEGRISGPFRAGVADIDAVNELFSQAFTDRYHRDGMSGARVPYLNPAVWRYAIAGAGKGALVWRDQAQRLVAFNMVHASGREGWMGPLAVRTDLQGRGVGRRIVSAGIALLKERGATTIGLETMPRTVDNIGFYTRLGFRPGHLTVTLSRRVPDQAGAPGLRISATGSERGEWVERCRLLVARLRPGADFSREIELTSELGLGDTTLLVEDGLLRGFAVWHGAALAADRAPEEVRVLKLVADSSEAGLRLVAHLESVAPREGVERLTLRAETAQQEGFARLVAAGYEVLWTDLRMTLAGYDEPCQAGGWVYSNWEI